MLGDLELLFALIRITNLFFILAWRPLPKEEEEGINHYNCPGGKWGENSLRRAAAVRKKRPAEEVWARLIICGPIRSPGFRHRVSRVPAREWARRKSLGRDMGGNVR